MAFFRATEGNGGGTVIKSMQVVDEQHAVWSQSAPASFTSKTFSMGAGDLLIVAILNRGSVTMPAKYTQIASQTYSVANDNLYTFSYFASAAESEQFSVSWTDTQRTEVCILQIRGATAASLQINTVQTNEGGGSTSAITPPNGNSIIFVARRYVMFNATSGMNTSSRQFAVFEAKPPIDGQWILAIVNFKTFLEGTFTVDFDRANPYAIAGISLDATA